MQRRSYTSIGAIGMAVALLTTAAVAFGSAPAGATYNAGVSSVHFEGSPDWCLPGQALPCTPGAGDGVANTIYVKQHKVGGQYRFNQIDTTSLQFDEVWLAADVAAQCRNGYKLNDFDIQLGHRTFDGRMTAPEEVSWGWSGHNVPIPNAKTMPQKKIAIHAPLDDLFGGNYIYGFGDMGDVFDEGEDAIDDRMDSGLSEAAARALPYEENTAVRMHARVICRGNSGAHLKYIKAVSRNIPLQFVYVPVPITPLRDTSRPGGFTTPPKVTGVAVEAMHDPSEPCAIQVSGVIQVDRTTDVAYRLVDVNGQQSNLIQRRVLAWLPLTIHHEIGIDDGGLDGIGFAGNGDGDEIGGLTDEDDDELEGTIRIKIVSPNLKYSNIDGWNVGHHHLTGC